MRLSTAQKFTAGFAAALVILLVGALSFRTERRALDAAGWVAHTHEVRGGLDALLAALVDVETGQRGYVITGAPRYLEPYESGVRRAPEALARVRRLTADNPRQQTRLDSLAPLVEARLAAAETVVATRRTEGLGPAAALVANDRGKRLMDAVRGILAAMQAEERALLGQRTTERATGEQMVAAVTLLGSAIAFALVVLMMRVIQQDVALQQRTAEERDAHLERERMARAQLAAIQRVTDAALAPLALDDLLTELMQRLRAVLAVDTACVHLVMRDGATLELCKCVGPTEELLDRVRVPVGRGVVGGIAARREAAVVEHLAAVDVYDPVLRERFASFLGAPLVVPARRAAGGAVATTDDERVIGVVHVETVETRRFSPDDVALLTLVAERAASAIERARLYEAERRSEERFRLLVDQVRDYAIFTLDAHGRMTSWNVGAERVKGWRADEVLGQPFAMLYPPEARERGDAEAHLRIAEAEGRWAGEGWRLRKDGTLFWAELVLTALRDDDDGHLLGFAKVTRDLSTQRRAEEALLAAKEAAEGASAAKSQFLATMSHEIRTPINAVLGYTELLEMGLDGPLTEGQRARLGRVRASGRHLLALVNELLDLAKIEAEQLHVERVRASASEAAATALGLVYPQAAARSLAITNRCVGFGEGTADASYMGDPHRVEQVLVNLVSNAVKFTPPGGHIEVECGVTETPSPDARLPDDASCWCYVRVSDTGPGIAPEQRDAVFDPFVQGEGASNPYTREHGGTGLGLAISRRLARLMGGDVTLASELGAGASFTLWLPAPPNVRGTADGRPTGCLVDERRADVGPGVGLARVGYALRDGVPSLVSAHVARLRARPDMPGAATLPDAELEDHLGTLLTDVARTLVLIEQAGGESSRAIRDSTEIQRVVAERHGVQRAALGWTAAHHRAELDMLRDGIEAALREALGAEHDPAIARALDVVARLLGHVERVGERARLSAAGA
ncbi:MAG TPA: CHASE3 domain-containing protein [Gemmatirosa sp.]|nr:CHASE3 domain-containing protein [Gemmatirosa sp.]